MAHASAPQPPNNRAVVSYAGRVYSRFSVERGVWCVPIDEIDERRLDDANSILREVLDNRIVLPPDEEFDLLAVDEPDVLDCGVGKGAWVDEFLREYEECSPNVVGVDVYFGQGLEDDDEEEEEEERDGIEEWTQHTWNLNGRFRHSGISPETFDLINSRLLAEGIDAARWPSYVVDLKNLLKPGGWLQMVELELKIQSNNGGLQYSMNEPLFLWQSWYEIGMRCHGKEPRIGRRLGELMRQAGFERVHAPPAKQLPIGTWNRHTSASLGADIRANLAKTIDALTRYPLTRFNYPSLNLPLPFDRWQPMVQRAQQELQRDDLQLYYLV
ncbi:Methyltransferase domain [Teratosphaeria destructans]|uniref:Methyltransferase domain n=1 Tax=Teratosphaeria destructans TaxID=418781 RepID=A0A9W7W6Y1_9PEZI|nr:Methyltransferase domain [Teratosphaeria destructans]